MNADQETFSPSIQSRNASQTTLVDASIYGIPQTVVSFLHDNMKNTKIFSSDGRVLYTVESDKAANARTTVYRGDTREVIVVVKRKAFRSDRIKFDDNPPVKLSSWLKGASGKWSDFPVSFEWGSSLHTWRTNAARQIALYQADDAENPIAWFQTSRRQEINGVLTTVRALLALQAEAQAVLDGVVVSLLVVEHGLRLRDMNIRTVR